MGEEWKGGDIANSPGGAFKINLLRKEMESHKGDWDLIVLFSDSYDVVAVGRYRLLQIIAKTMLDVIPHQVYLYTVM